MQDWEQQAAAVVTTQRGISTNTATWVVIARTEVVGVLGLGWGGGSWLGLGRWVVEEEVEEGMLGVVEVEGRGRGRVKIGMVRRGMEDCFG